jgi:magnesium chelatase family protein
MPDLRDVKGQETAKRAPPQAGITRLAGDLAGGRIGRTRPFRAPHHSASMAALVGGGTRPRPGEVALAHLGVLFLDELPEFAAQALDALRQPLEAGETVIARANHRISYPSRVQLIAAMNPCRCCRAGEPGYAAARAAVASNATRPASQGRCSTASICRSRCLRSVPQTSCCLPPLKEAPRFAPVSLRPGRSRPSASPR